jgi:basic membrane protein A
MRLKMKVGAVLAAGALALAGCGGDSGGDGASGEGSDISVGLAYDIAGRGDQSFNDAAAAGLERAKTELGVEVNELEASAGNETEAQKEERLRLLASSGNNPVIAVGFAFTQAVTNVAKAFPDTSFAIVDSVVEAPNVASLVFAEEQGSYLVGAIAAQASQSGDVGFIGGQEIPLIKKFEAGYVAGAKAVNPAINVQIRYLAPAGDATGFADPGGGRVAANAMYESGADVVYHAAGGSGAGVFEAAKAAEALAIGVDSDQYLTAPEEIKPVIITSMIKRVDVAVFNMVQSVVDGSPLTGVQEFDLEAEGVGYSTSNAAVEPYTAKADELAQQIIDGTITVPKS